MKLTLPTLCLVAALLSGCVATAPEWNSRFGDASRQARAAQVIDPDAPTRNTALGSTDGKAVAGMQNAYAEKFGYGVKEAKQPTLVINNGAGQ